MFASRANPGGIDQEKWLSVAFIEDIDGVTGCAWQFAYDGAGIRKIELIRDDFPAFGRPTIARARGSLMVDARSMMASEAGRRESIVSKSARCRGHVRR